MEHKSTFLKKDKHDNNASNQTEVKELLKKTDDKMTQSFIINYSFGLDI